MAGKLKTHRVSITNANQTIDCASDQTILQAAILAGIDYPYICATGNCGTCLCQLESGEVSMLPRSDASLTPEQVKAGQKLACRALPCGDVTIKWLSRGGK
jgi:naphthalene 1,2-dioxygenase ferredoxin reductase component